MNKAYDGPTKGKKLELSTRERISQATVDLSVARMTVLEALQLILHDDDRMCNNLIEMTG